MKRLIVGVGVIVVACACNPFGQYKCRARQTEAKSTLGAIKIAEASYFAEHKAYTASVTELGVALTTRDYSLELSITGGGKGYKAIAKGDKPETTGDEWSVDEAGTVTATSDLCAR
jgi:type IV pilus assembly protein PilA